MYNISLVFEKESAIRKPIADNADIIKITLFHNNFVKTFAQKTAPIATVRSSVPM